MKKVIGLAIYRARHEHAMTQEQFAELLGKQLARSVDWREIGRWERGEVEPKATVLLAAAHVAGLTVSEILREDRIGKALGED